MPSRSCHHRLISWWATTGGRETKTFGINQAAASRRWWWGVWALQSALLQTLIAIVSFAATCHPPLPRALRPLVWLKSGQLGQTNRHLPLLPHNVYTVHQGRVISQGGQGGVRQLLAVSISDWLLRSRWHALDAWLHKSVRTGPRSSLACVLYTNPTPLYFPRC